jgi:drug/metabolite transporter superfamily protein YnfA
MLLNGTGGVDPILKGDVEAGADPDAGFEWTALVILQVYGLFLLAGLAEIGGGWLIWQALRESKQWWWALCGSVVLVAYGFIPTLQPLSDFGRLYAVYGGIFIGLSYCWGVVFDGMKVDRGDVIGSCLALTGVGVALFWPRSGS